MPTEVPIKQDSQQLCTVFSSVSHYDGLQQALEKWFELVEQADPTAYGSRQQDSQTGNGNYLKWHPLPTYHQQAADSQIGSRATERP
jgi:hypothetical protein